MGIDDLSGLLEECSDFSRLWLDLGLAARLCWGQTDRQLSGLAHQSSFHIWSRNHGNLDVLFLKTDRTLHECVEEGDDAFHVVQAPQHKIQHFFKNK